MRRRLRAVGFALVFAAALAARGASAQSLATVRVDDVRVTPDGRHRVLVSVLDPGGAPVPDLAQAFRVDVDGTRADALVVQSSRERYSSALVTLVVDARLLRGEALQGVRDAVRALAPSLAPGDRVRVLAVGASMRVREAAAGDLAKLEEALGGMAADDAPVLYDALYDAAREASRLPDDRDGLVLVVTRGSDAASRHAPFDVVATANSRGRLASVLVALVGDEGAAAETERLRRLADHTGGALVRVTSPGELASSLPQLLDRGLHRWALAFRVPGWDRTRPKHHLSITVERGDERRHVDSDYDTADVLPAAWWRSPLPWLMLGASAVAIVAALVFTRRRQLALLVHDGDDDDGVWYEVFGYPVTLGAAQGNDIVFLDEQVSRNHAVLERRGRNIELADLNSENGTFLNGERISRRVLADGDRVSLGPAVHLIYEARG